MIEKLSRRSVLGGIGVGASLLSVPAWAQGHDMRGGRHGGGHSKGGPLIPAGFDEVSGTEINLSVGGGYRMVEGRRGSGIAVNGSVPGPLIRLTEGQNVRLNVTNTLDVDTSVHWHGLFAAISI